MLMPGEMDTVKMPGLIPQKGTLTYQFELKKPNGRKDASRQDNFIYASYSQTPVHDSTLIFIWKPTRSPKTMPINS